MAATSRANAALVERLVRDELDGHGAWEQQHLSATGGRRWTTFTTSRAVTTLIKCIICHSSNVVYLRCSDILCTEDSMCETRFIRGISAY